jgi:catechol 2,3-dioxygenase-like lactoylglutathione lyase family enzyme
MTAPTAVRQIQAGADATVSGIQHVGHVVRDIEAAIALYRRMGFLVPPPSFPALAPHPGEPLRAFGTGNTHISFRRTFVELVTAVDDRRGRAVGADANLVPLQAPADVFDRLTESITHTATRMSEALARFEGLHILVFGTANADASIARLAAEGVAHGAVNRLQRPALAGEATKPVSIGYVEIDSDPGLSPEGRLALAEDGPADSGPLMGRQSHPNGAIELIESVLCVPDADLEDYVRRYARYLQRPGRSDRPLHVFDLGSSRVLIVPDSALGSVLPGEVPPALPAFVGYGLAVHDLPATQDLWERADFPVQTSPLGGRYIPAADALGAAVIFYPAQSSA